MEYLTERIYSRCPIPIQNLIMSDYGRRLLKERFGADFTRLAAFLERSQWMTPDELRACQEERLRLVIGHAYENVPYYREIMDALSLRPSDIETIDDLPKLPILTKEAVRAHAERLISRTANRRDLKKIHSAGTTGSSLFLYWDHAVDVMNNACMWRGRRWAGFEFGRPYATLLGRAVVPLRQTRPPFWRVNRSWNQLFLSPLHLKEENAPAYLSAMREFGVEALDAYPTSAYLLARFLEAEGEYLPLTCVFTTSEPLLGFEREMIEERFRCRVFDGYGQAERVMYSSECERHTGHHVYDEYGITELVDDEGAPVRDGYAGLVVATGLHNLGMPLIRYAVNDTATMSTRRCECGRGLPLLEGVAMRAEDVIVTPGGRMVPPLLLARAFKLIPGIVRSQIIQHIPDEITTKLVVRAPLSPDVEERFRRNLCERLGPDVAVRIQYVDEIPLAGRGKYRRVISTVPLRWGSTRTDNLFQTGEEADAARSRPSEGCTGFSDEESAARR